MDISNNSLKPIGFGILTCENLEQAMEEFLAKREKLRSDKDFNQADVMRDKLKEIGLLIKDGDDSAWYWENS